MFYSQFILAKKGPLGTIWIAAHLERKLRKNQVADTDIGVSVDSILSPDVPIALRLSSHLLLGVVRIYNKKVNYLFDDCSEALLKVKQAFRSTAVDLPPEESKAPYHSITLPEKFDLDDFELPDSDIFQGNYVDHHISSREQITLQDTMDGVSYSTSKFGLDERFGDGDMSGLDLEEELLMEKLGTAEPADEGVDPQTSFGSTSTLKQDQHPEDMGTNSEAMVDGGGACADVLDYAHAPCTPRLEDEPIFSKVQEASACDDHLESEYHITGSTMRENMDTAPYEDKQEVEWSSQNDMITSAVPQGPPAENGYLSGGLEAKETGRQGQTESIKPASECTSEIVKESDVPEQTEAINNSDRNDLVSIDEAHRNDQCPNEVGPGVSKGEPETQICQGTIESRTLNLDAHDQVSATETNVLRPCSSIQDQDGALKPAVGPTYDGDVNSVIYVEATDRGEETAKLGQVHSLNGNSEENTKENKVQHDASGEDIVVAAVEADGLENATTELPAPEKLLSVPEGHMELHSGMMMEVIPRDFEGLYEDDAGSKTAAGRKRTFTESTLTEQSLNSVESSRQVRFKQTTGSVPDDDDLLSSILVGRNTSMLRVKPTPPPSEVTSMKRHRAAPRSGGPKRKVLMDETMVLHGDAIRQQLTNTEDIRRVRKKAPCTRSEISMIQKQHMVDETFLEPVFADMSVELASLHNRVYDLGQIKVCQNEVHDASPQIVSELRQPSQNDENIYLPETMVEPDINSHREKSGACLETVVMDDNEGPGMTNAIEIGGQDKNGEFLRVIDNETAEPCDNHLLSENKIEEVDYTSAAVNEEWTKPTTVDAALIDSGATSDILHASDGIVQAASINESEGTNAYADKDEAVVLDQREAVPSDELDFAEVNHEQAMGNEGKDTDGYGGECETELGVKDYGLPEMTQDAAAGYGGPEYHVQDEIYSTTSKDQLDLEFPYTGFESLLQGGSMDQCKDPEAYQLHMIDGDISGFDLHDRDELNYLAEGNDTDFLNVDDDDLAEMADDYMPDAEDTRLNENIGWSSRTRAVSKYLQSAFIKERQCGRASLSLDNLLIGKSRKEASRMFFETLVLKTRDYIHVEEPIAFGDITIRPRTRLMKSDF
ncbi:sister chromatid cohesion 1 protein 4-like [Salvia hispanica]|uniref:sister chromatid cohesion 1 protein 4-like n=1 Tax=Salvia hispanica TaxID=49212 RepID=UPI002009978E|nr:sister chromatid cohesion 1 protein 4-like [Salvia hispanica]XP_047968638.1 sister chromatid cohesion 1 protein 4-like [Salvia hispanica]